MSMVVLFSLVVFGTSFLLLAAIGILRMPDLYCRASATTKAATLGVGCLLAATAIYFNDLQVTTRVLATIAFLLLTAPVAAHMIARAAYRQRIPLWSGTVRDELAVLSEKAADSAQVDKSSFENVELRSASF